MQVRRRPASGGEDDTEQTTRLLHASSLQSASVTDFAFCWACGHSMIDSSICEETAVHRGVVTQLYACAHCQAIGYKMGGSAPSGPASKGGSVLRHVVASLVWILASMITAVGLFYVLPWTVKNPQLPDMYRVPLPWVSYALAGMTFWHLTMVYCGTSWYQPPQLLRGNPLRRDVAAGQFSGMRWCYRCEHARPSMVHHCSQCGKCVVGMDHHCAFLGTCVAKRNHGAFFSFLAATTVSCGFVAAVLYRALRMTRMLNGMYVGGLVGLLPERVTGRAPSSTVSALLHELMKAPDFARFSVMMVMLMLSYGVFVFVLSMLVMQVITVQQGTGIDGARHPRGMVRWRAIFGGWHPLLWWIPKLPPAYPASKDRVM